jgi:hypothetical protein
MRYYSGYRAELDDAAHYPRNRNGPSAWTNRQDASVSYVLTTLSVNATYHLLPPLKTRQLCEQFNIIWRNPGPWTLVLDPRVLSDHENFTSFFTFLLWKIPCQPSPNASAPLGNCQVSNHRAWCNGFGAAEVVHETGRCWVRA